MTPTHPKSTKQLMKEDELQLYLAKAQEWLQTNAKTLMIVLVGAVVVSIIAVAMNISRRNANRDAGYDLAEARVQLTKGDLQQAADKLNALIKKRKGTEIADEAVLTLGRIKLIENKFDDAEKYFRQYQKENSGKDIRMIGATNGLAVCLESKGKLAEAFDQYRKVYEMDKTGIAAPQALMDAARVALALGKNDQAREYALTLQHNFPQSQLRSAADDILNRVGR